MIIQLQTFNTPNFIQQLFDGRKIEVTFEESGYRAKQLVCVAEQLPGLVVDGAAVRVDTQILVLDVVTGKVEIAYALTRHGAQKLVCVVAMINAVDDNIVDIEHQVAVCFVKNGQQELLLGH